MKKRFKEGKAGSGLEKKKKEFFERRGKEIKKIKVKERSGRRGLVPGN